MKKKLLTLLLSMAMFVTMMPTMAFAEPVDDTVCQVTSADGTVVYATYTSLKGAVDAVNAGTATGTNIVMLKNATETDFVEVATNTTIKLNGKRLAKDDGMNLFVPKDGAKLTIDGTAAGSEVFGRVLPTSNGDVELKGGYYSANGEVVNVQSGDSDVTLNGATIVATNSNAIYFDGNGTLKINGGAITGKADAIYSEGDVEVENATLKGVNGSAIEVDDDSLELIIKSGNFEGKTEALNIDRHYSVAISGGSFSDLTMLPYLTPDANVKLTRNVDLPSSAQYSFYKGVTIDLGNNTVTCADSEGLAFGGNNLTLKNGAIIATNSALIIGEQNHDITGVTLEKIDCTGGIVAQTADVKLVNTKVIASGTNNVWAVKAHDNSKITIESGEYTSNHSAVLGCAGTGNSSIVITGGKFTAPTTATDMVATKSNVVVSGGKFKPGIGTATLASGYTVLAADASGYREVVPEKKHNVTFDAAGGTAVTKQEVYTNGTATQPTTTKTGYKVKAWHLTTATGAVWDFATPITSDIKLVAEWEAIKYKVEFKANDGTTTTAIQDMVYDTPKALTANTFKRNGYVFTGWNTLSTGKGTPYTDGQTVKNLKDTEGATITLYAQWEKQSKAAGGTTTVDASKDVKISGTTAKLALNATDVDNIMKEVNATTSNIKVNAVSSATGALNVTTAQIEVPVVALVEKLTAKKAPIQNVEFKTNVGTISFDGTALASIYAQVKKVNGTVVTIEIKKIVNSQVGNVDQDYEITIKTNDTAKTAIADFAGGIETVTVPVPATLTGKGIGVLYVKADQSVESVKSSKTATEVTFTTGHNSVFRLTTADSAAAQIKPLVNKATVKQSKLVAYKNGKIKVTWTAAEGYTVENYVIYRSTKKKSGFKKVGTVKADTLTFTNAKSLKKGTKYYYKVCGTVTLDNGDTARTAWSNVRYAKCKKTVK